MSCIQHTIDFKSLAKPVPPVALTTKTLNSNSDDSSQCRRVAGDDLLVAPSDHGSPVTKWAPVGRLGAGDLQLVRRGMTTKCLLNNRARPQPPVG
ncbi:hypothetical protein Pan189_25580 [Stratiformator vulcanicus]|uniref:Uncharacterized protein n=1 Tax=Stratiformator vulcanicus TaxID=2527980 RepID=A0A517R2S0_9PLAN|nr:hypothetical protein Pan189_25580 [Stratiformator vulcanicus]